MHTSMNVHKNNNYTSVQHIIHASLLREVIHDAALLAALDKLLRFVVIKQCVYVTFYIKHHAALPLIITAPSPDAASSKHLNYYKGV